MIAHGTGKAGQFAKGVAERHLRQMFWATMTAIGVIASFGGVSLGIWVVPVLFQHVATARRAPQSVYFVAFALSVGSAVLVSWVMFRWVSRTLDKSGRERIRALQGGHAEAVVAMTLAGLSDDWHLFNGVAMKGGGDIDHVLVGPGGVFAVSTKSTRGTYAVGADGRLTLNGESCDHRADAQTRALKLRTWLEVMLHENPAVQSIPYVRPILVAPFTRVTFPAKRDNVWVMDDCELHDEAANARRVLKPAEVAGCVAVLQRLTGMAARPAKVVTIPPAASTPT